MMNPFNQRFYRWQTLLLAVAVIGCTYTAICLFLLLWQRHLIYRPQPKLAMLPSAIAFNLPYEDVWIPIADSKEQLHGW